MGGYIRPVGPEETRCPANPSTSPDEVHFLCPGILRDGEGRGPAVSLLGRNYDCSNYATCLGVAAALDWSSFSCYGCSGRADSRLLWRAHSALKKNKDLCSVCNLPKPGFA